MNVSFFKIELLLDAFYKNTWIVKGKAKKIARNMNPCITRSSKMYVSVVVSI